ncbi:MAG: hypothetical protein ABSE49_19975 [Polyangiaceae bacterium]
MLRVLGMSLPEWCASPHGRCARPRERSRLLRALLPNDGRLVCDARLQVVERWVSSGFFGAFHWKLAVDEGLIAMSIEDGSTDAAPPLSTTVMMAAAKQRPRWPPGR